MVLHIRIESALAHLSYSSADYMISTTDGAPSYNHDYFLTRKSADITSLAGFMVAHVFSDLRYQCAGLPSQYTCKILQPFGPPLWSAVYENKKPRRDGKPAATYRLVLKVSRQRTLLSRSEIRIRHALTHKDIE